VGEDFLQPSMKRVMQSAIEQHANSDKPKHNFMRSPEKPDPLFPRVTLAKLREQEERSVE
jgi:hypothetical protein